MFGFSIKQLLRQPGKAILFFLLMAASTALVVTGAALTIENNERIRIVEETYATVGYATQTPISTETEVYADPCYGTVTDITPKYGDPLKADVLNFPGAIFVAGPEFRPYYISYLPKMLHCRNWYNHRHIVEFVPLKSTAGNEGPVDVEITRVIFSNVDAASREKVEGYEDHNLQVGDVIPLCQHGAQTAYPLKAGVRYVSTIVLYGEPCPEHGVEYWTYIAPHSNQRDTEGNLIDTGYFKNPGNEEDFDRSSRSICEVTGEDFYEKGQPGYKYLQWVDIYNMEDYLFTTTATNAMELLPSWHNKSMSITSGREIGQEEFDSGAAVCLVPDMLAKKNGLALGDKVNLPLLCSWYGQMGYFGRIPYDFSLFDAGGSLYEPFWEQEYEIVGIYLTNGDFTHEIAEDMFIIPAKSVGASDENNIAWFDIMSKDTASFQIPNGSIQRFDMALKEHVPEAGRLSITYDDRGYSEIKKSLDNARGMARLLLLGGVLAALSIIALLLYFFVVKEKKRTAIERSLGMTKAQCRVSLLSGFMILTVLSASAGSLCGVLVLDQVRVPRLAAGTAEERDRAYIYDTRYSTWAAGRELAEKAEIKVEPPVYVGYAVPLCVSLLALLSALLLMAASFRTDPIYLLSARERE